MKSIDASKLGISSFKRIITFGELCLTFVRVLWDNGDPDDPELVGVVYCDQTGQHWCVNDDKNLKLEIN